MSTGDAATAFAHTHFPLLFPVYSRQIGSPTACASLTSRYASPPPIGRVSIQAQIMRSTHAPPDRVEALGRADTHDRGRDVVRR